MKERRVYPKMIETKEVCPGKNWKWFLSWSESRGSETKGFMVEGRGQKFMFFIIPQRLIKGKISGLWLWTLSKESGAKYKNYQFYSICRRNSTLWPDIFKVETHENLPIGANSWDDKMLRMHSNTLYAIKEYLLPCKIHDWINVRLYCWNLSRHTSSSLLFLKILRVLT